MGHGVKSFSLRARRGALVAVLSVAGLIVSAAPPAAATATFSFTRIAGSDRFATAAQSASDAFPAGAGTALVANGQTAHFPDALAASYAAGFEKAPILLTLAGSVPSATSAALKSLNVKNVIIVGGTAAVGSAVADKLKSDGYTVSRVAGQSRYGTGAALAALPPKSNVGSSTAGSPTAVVASGKNFPDALVSGPLGFGASFPIEITDPASLSPETKQSLQSLGIKHAVITGGPAAVSTTVENQIKALGITTERFQGVDRTETAALVAAFEVDSLGFSSTTIDLARGDDPADSLAGSPFGGVNKTPLLLTVSPTVLGTKTRDYIGAHSDKLASGKIFGGTGAVSGNVQTEATAAGRGANSVTVSASPSTVKANGSSTSTVTVKVTDADGTAIANDGVAFTTDGSPTTACGTLSATTATTGTNGQAATTYTASKTAGTCTITATESNGGGHGTTTITQTVTNVVDISATPSSVKANGTDTSAVKVKVTNLNGAAVANDTVTFSKSGSPAGACGSLPTTSTTDSSGNLSVTYTASTTSGFCTITATESGTGASNSVPITQTSPSPPPSPNKVTVTATNNPIKANGTDKSTINVKVVKSDGTTAVGSDPINLTTSGTCGTVSPTSGTTDASGIFSATYTASTTAGTCTITATESFTAAQDDVAVTQTAPNTVALSSSSSTDSVQADGSSKLTLSAKVTNGSTNVGNDAVTFTATPTTPSACDTTFPKTATTDPTTGVATVIYTATTTAGFCTITATESATGASDMLTITQTQNPPTVSPNQVQIDPSTKTVPPGDKTSFDFTVTVTTRTGSAVPNDTVSFTKSESSPGTCGTLSKPSGTTDVNGELKVTYTPTGVAGTCTVTATEADGGSSADATVTQQAQDQTQNLALSADKSTIKANGHDTSTITATITDANGTGISGKVVTFTDGSPTPPGACDTSFPKTGTTDNLGKASVTYTSTTKQGTCSVTASATGTTPPSRSTTITQAGFVFVSGAATGAPETSPPTPATTTITLTYNEPAVCASVDSDASDYAIVVDNDPQWPRPAGEAAPHPISYTASCSGTTNSVVTLTVTTFPVGGHFVTGQHVTVTAKAGGDMTTVISASSAMQQAAGDSVIFTVT